MIHDPRTGAIGGKPRWIQRGILGVVCALVAGIYALTARDGAETQLFEKPAGSYYNLLVQGFRSGQLNLKKEAPAKLAQLADPYSATAARPAGFMDLSYYNGKLYLYYGVTPAVILFWPYVALTGHYLSSKAAVVFFCLVGFLVSVGLLCAIWRRHFADVSVGVVAAGTLALGLATLTTPFLAQCDLWQVPISCGYMLTMLTLAAIWQALHKPAQRGWYLAGASLAFGLAVGSRPSLLLGAIVLLVPVIHAWRERQPIWLSLTAATAPMTLIVLCLMLYNAQRFGNPFEFGAHYAITTWSLVHRAFFATRFFWSNVRSYFFAPAHWSSRFPFVHGDPFGVLNCLPLTWVAAASALAWCQRAEPARSVLRWFVISATLLFGICLLLLEFYLTSTLRYEMDFVPALVLLAVIGILSLERSLAFSQSWRRAMRWVWGLLLAFSVVFSLSASCQRCAAADNEIGLQFQQAGQIQSAMRYYERALRLDPECVDAHMNLGNTLVQSGRLPEAIEHFEQALRIEPDSPKKHNDFGVVLAQLGRLPEAVRHWERAVTLDRDFFEAHNNLGIALMATGRLPEAIGQYEQALKINPDYAEAHNNLGLALRRTGRLPEAIRHYEQALRLEPDLAEAHYNLGISLKETGQVTESIRQLEQALQLQPADAKAQIDLGSALAQEGKFEEATKHFEQALQINPRSAEADFSYAVALQQAGRIQEAISHYEEALCRNPDYPVAQDNLERLLAGR